MNILITGSQGFIGSNLYKYLLAKGHRVFGVDNLSGKYPPSYYETHENLDYFKCDISNAKSLNQINQKVDVIIHLAAKTGVRDSFENPNEYYKSNIIGTQNVLDLAHAKGVKKIIFASSSSVYGNNKLPFTESLVLDPLNYYAVSKVAGENICRVYSELHGIDIFALRFFTVYGADARYDMAIHKFTSFIKQGKGIDLFGDCKRDFTHVNDAIRAIELCVNSDLKGFRVYNVGGNKPYEIEKIVYLLTVLLNKKILIKHLKLNFGEMVSTFANIKKIRKELGWRPIIKIPDGLKMYIEGVKDET